MWIGKLGIIETGNDESVIGELEMVESRIGKLLIGKAEISSGGRGWRGRAQHEGARWVEPPFKGPSAFGRQKNPSF